MKLFILIVCLNFGFSTLAMALSDNRLVVGVLSDTELISQSVLDGRSLELTLGESEMGGCYFGTSHQFWIATAGGFSVISPEMAKSNKKCASLHFYDQAESSYANFLVRKNYYEAVESQINKLKSSKKKIRMRDKMSIEIVNIEKLYLDVEVRRYGGTLPYALAKSRDNETYIFRVQKDALDILLGDKILMPLTKQSIEIKNRGGKSRPGELKITVEHTVPYSSNTMNIGLTLIKTDMGNYSHYIPAIPKITISHDEIWQLTSYLRENGYEQTSCERFKNIQPDGDSSSATYGIRCTGIYNKDLLEQEMGLET